MIELVEQKIVQITAHARLHLAAMQQAIYEDPRQSLIILPAIKDFLTWHGMTTAAADNLLKLFFQNTGWANVGDATGLVPSTVAGSIYVSLTTADPTVTGTQTTSESAYTNYARQAVARSGAGWTESAASAANAAIINFPACGVTGSTVTFVGLGSAVSGAGNLYASGALTSPASLAISSGITPSFAIGALTCVAS
jgi:hypothetical protein